MSEPTVIKVVDDGGTVHWTAPGSQLAKSARPAERVISDATEAAAAGDDHDTAESGSGSGDRPGNHPGTGGGGRRTRKAQPTPGG